MPCCPVREAAGGTERRNRAGTVSYTHLGDILVRFGGYDFREADTDDKKYYMATTESGIYVAGALGGFQTRTISIGNGWFGIIKVSGDNMNLVMTVTNTPIRTSVSYTHLDVYKRQTLACPGGVEKIFSRLRGGGPSVFLRCRGAASRVSGKRRFS